MGRKGAADGFGARRDRVGLVGRESVQGAQYRIMHPNHNWRALACRRPATEVFGIKA